MATMSPATTPTRFARSSINDLIEAARNFGAGSISGLETLDGANAKQLRSAVDSATIEILSGKDDHLLRRLFIKADFGVDVDEELRKALGSFAGAHVAFDMTIANPNEPVHVDAPADAKPFPS